MSDVPIIIRPGAPDDANFIYHSWITSTMELSPFIRDYIDYGDYHKSYQIIIRALLKRSSVTVACNPDDTSQIYGFAVFDANPGSPVVVHYIYVKHPYRTFGIASLLFADLKRKAVHEKDAAVVATINNLWFDRLKDRWDLVYYNSKKGLSNEDRIHKVSEQH